MPNELFSARLLRYRSERKLTQEQMGEMLGVSARYVGMLEKGEKEVEPSSSLAKLFALMEANRVPPAQRLAGRQLLKSAREAKGMTPAQLAKTVGYSVAVYQQIESGHSQMSEKMAEKVARALDVRAEDLLAGSDHPVENGALRGTFGSKPDVGLGPGMQGAKAKFVPLLSMAQCGTQMAWTDEGYTREGFLAFDPKDRDAFAVTLSGDSMTPVYSPGDVALVYPNHSPRNGDLVIAVLNDEAGGDVMFKVFQASGDRVTLSSYNPAYPPMEFPRSSFRKLCPVAAITKVLRRDRG